MTLDVPDTPGLSWMERSVQGLMALDYTGAEIAKIMGVSFRYIRKIRLHLRTKRNQGTLIAAPEYHRNQGTTIAEPGFPKPHGTVLDLRAGASDSSPKSSPDPVSQSSPNPEKKARRKKTSSSLAASRPLNGSDPLIGQIKAAFVSQYPGENPDWNWPAQMQAIKRLVARVRQQSDPEDAIKRILEQFAWLVFKSQDKFWRQQPFSPQALSSEGIYTRVLKYMEGERSVVDDVFREMEEAKK